MKVEVSIGEMHRFELRDALLIYRENRRSFIVSIRARPYFRARMQGDELEAWTTQQSRLSTVAAAPPRLPQLWRDLSRAD